MGNCASSTPTAPVSGREQQPPLSPIVCPLCAAARPRSPLPRRRTIFYPLHDEDDWNHVMPFLDLPALVALSAVNRQLRAFSFPSGADFAAIRKFLVLPVELKKPDDEAKEPEYDKLFRDVPEWSSMRKATDIFSAINSSSPFWHHTWRLLMLDCPQIRLPFPLVQLEMEQHGTLDAYLLHSVATGSSFAVCESTTPDYTVDRAWRWVKYFRNCHPPDELKKSDVSFAAAVVDCYLMSPKLFWRQLVWATFRIRSEIVGPSDLDAVYRGFSSHPIMGPTLTTAKKNQKKKNRDLSRIVGGLVQRWMPVFQLVHERSMLGEFLVVASSRRTGDSEGTGKDAGSVTPLLILWLNLLRTVQTAAALDLNRRYLRSGRGIQPQQNERFTDLASQKVKEAHITLRNLWCAIAAQVYEIERRSGNHIPLRQSLSLLNLELKQLRTVLMQEEREDNLGVC